MPTPLPTWYLMRFGAESSFDLSIRSAHGQKSNEYLKINPNGRIPTLVDEDTVVFEAAAIVLHLVDSHPQHGLAPAVGTPERAKFYQWLIFLTNSLQEELMVWQYPERLAGGDAAAKEVVKRGAEARASTFLDVIEDHLKTNGPLFLGDKLSAVDFYLVMLSRWARPMTKPPRSRPHSPSCSTRSTALPRCAAPTSAKGSPTNLLTTAPSCNAPGDMSVPGLRKGTFFNA